jgi:hypothetical protein
MEYVKMDERAQPNWDGHFCPRQDDQLQLLHEIGFSFLPPQTDDMLALLNQPLLCLSFCLLRL